MHVATFDIVRRVSKSLVFNEQYVTVFDCYIPTFYHFLDKKTTLWVWDVLG